MAMIYAALFFNHMECQGFPPGGIPKEKTQVFYGEIWATNWQADSNYFGILII